jgi:hypothetical protein
MFLLYSAFLLAGKFCDYTVYQKAKLVGKCWLWSIVDYVKFPLDHPKDGI